MKIHSENEWDKLNSVVVGRGAHARFPINDPGFGIQAVTTTWDETIFPQGDFPDSVTKKASTDLEMLIGELMKLGIHVHRPDYVDFRREIATYDWETDGMSSYCPRDTLLVIGNKVIETPMTYRSRQMEVRAYETIKRQAMAKGVVWLSAPKPTLLYDEVYVEDGKQVLTEEYPLFDAANVCRLGKDLLYLVSSTGNYCGADWLQGILGSEYKIHIVDNLYSYAHIDSTISPVSEGKVLLNGSRVNDQNCPKVFKDWERIYIDENDIVKQYFHSYPYASSWIAMNLLAIAPNKVIMESGQPFLRKKLEQHEIEVIETPFSMARTLGGGIHCATLDLNRG